MKTAQYRLYMGCNDGEQSQPRIGNEASLLILGIDGLGAKTLYPLPSGTP